MAYTHWSSSSDALSRNGLLDAQVKKIIPQSKPFLTDVVIKRGTFQIFSRVGHPTEPVLQWQNDLHFTAESIDTCLLLERIEISGLNFAVSSS